MNLRRKRCPFDKQSDSVHVACIFIIGYIHCQMAALLQNITAGVLTEG